MFNATLTCSVWRIRNAVLLPGVCGLACIAAACGGRPVTRDFRGLSTATRIEVHDVGVRPLAVITDPERIQVARVVITCSQESSQRPATAKIDRVLAGEETGKKYSHLTPEIRQAIAEILKSTLP